VNSKHRVIRERFRAMGPRGFMRAAWAKLGFEVAFPVFERLGIHVLPIHYYSPVPDTRQLRKDFGRWHREWSFLGIDFDMDEERKLVQDLTRFRSELQRLPSHAEIAARGLGEGYGEVEASVLHAMLRSLKPSLVVEVGSGVSTFYTVHALAVNKQEHGTDSHIKCIDPYPRPELRALSATAKVPLEIIPAPVQDVEISLFQELGEGDVLFVDSSHISRLDSDVDRLYLEIFPCLRPGVLIHIHDIPFPFLVPNPEHWIFTKHKFWNEAPLLAAFLAFNASFKIMLSLSYLHHKFPEVLQALMTYDRKVHEPTSIWLKRIC
jgi:hypothetical protein